jgi:hypothetical protein
MSKLLALGCVVILAVLAFGQRSTVTQANFAATPEVAVTAAATQQAAVLSNGWTLAAQQSKQDVPDPRLSVTIAKPVLSGPTDPRIGHFNDAADYLVTQMIDNFKNELKQIGTPSPEMPTDLPGSAMDINYEILAATERVIGVQFHVYYYVTGAAHPNSFTVPINYDLKTDKILTLADLFKPKADYLTVLSNYAVQELQKTPEIFMFPEGAAAKDENYRSWNITPAGLLITFDPYQVAPYAAGPQRVLVPYATLKPILDPAGPLASFAP